MSLYLLERLILNRKGPEIDRVIPQEQAGLRKPKGCTDQVLSLTNFIKYGFQKQKLVLIRFMLSDRLLSVFINDKNSKTRILNNGLPQGAVLAPMLFNL